MTRRSSFVAEIQFVVDAVGTLSTFYFGTEGWSSKPTDTPANTHISGSLADPGSIRSELFSGARLTGPVRPSFGQIVLKNAQGELDSFMNYGMGGTVTVRYGVVGDAYPTSWTTVIVAYAYALIVDFKEIRVVLRDRLFLLEKPIVTKTFANIGGFTGTGIATKKQQLVLGRPGLIPLVLFDQNDQIYFVHDNGASDRQFLANPSSDYNVFDGGVPLTRGVPYETAADGLATAPDPGEFRIYAEGAATDVAYESTGPVYVRLGSPPAFELRVQPHGLLKNSPDSRARPWTFVDLLNRAGIVDVTPTNLSSGSTLLVAGNRLIDGDQTYLEVMADVAGARFNAFGFDRLNTFFMFDLRLGVEGSETSVHTFTKHNAKDFRRQPVPGQESPVWQVSVNSGDAWPSQIANSLTTEEADKFQRNQQQSFTGTADSVRLANPGAESATMDVVGNEFSTLPERKAFVKRYFELFGGRRDLISLTAPLSADTISIGLHDKVTIEIDRFNCNSGRDFRVVMSDLNLRARTATFWLWGGDVGPSDAVLGGGSSDTGGGSVPAGGFQHMALMGDFTFYVVGVVAGGVIKQEGLMGDFTFITNFSAALPDPYFAYVILLIQGGADASTTMQDLSSYASVATITNYATFDNAHQVFGNNPIKTTTNAAAIGSFNSTGTTSRFGRATGDKVTIECWVYIDTLENFASSSFQFAWWRGSNRILEVGTYGPTATAKVRLRNGDDAAIETASISAGVLHFLQMNIDNGAYTLDLDGVQIYSGTNTYEVGFAGTFDFYVGAQNSVGNTAAPTTKVWASPLRFTKGVLRARGSVPTAAFPTF